MTRIVRRVLTPTLLSLALVVPLAACDDDTPASDAGNGADNGGGADTGGDMGEDTGGGGDTGGDTGGGSDAGEDPLPLDVTDEPDAVALPACEPFAPEGGSASYDLVSPLQKFVGVAEISIDGNTVDVVIPVPDEEDTTFTGEFDEGSSCVTAVVDQNLTAEICFYTADGEPSEPGVLGANLYAFIAGAPRVRPTATLLGAAARGADRSCSAGGWYELDASGVSLEEGDLPEAVVAAATTDFLSYVGLFDTGRGVSSVTGIAEPAENAIDEGNPRAGDIQLEISSFLVVDEVTYDVELQLDGTVDLETGVMTGNVELFLDDAEGTEGTLSGEFTATRN